MKRPNTNAARLKGRVSVAEHSYLMMGLDHRDGRLPLFDAHGQEVRASIIKSCAEKGFIEPWFANPMRPKWRVYRLTNLGTQAAQLSPADIT